MKKNRLLLLGFLVGITALSAKPDCCSKASGTIHLNQLGYLPGAAKYAVVPDSDAESFSILQDCEVVFEGKLTSAKKWDASGESVKLADFSSFTIPGEYTLSLDSGKKSYAFNIKDHLYSDALVAAMKSFYLHRSGIDIEEQYAGEYARKRDHMYDNVLYHSSTGKTEGSKPSLGGWYDAGDYGKYIVNAGVSVATMLQLYENHPEILADDTLNIPESGNQVSDLLDELRFELEWMLTMQDADGGVYHKVTALGFEGFVMPDEVNDQRFFIGKSTNSSVVFAGTLAQASRVFQDVDEAFAQKLLDSARKAWDWSLENPDELYIKNPKDVHTGAYNNGDLSDEFFWAAVELFATTAEKGFKEYAETHARPLKHQLEESWRTYYLYLAYYTLALHGDSLAGIDAKASVLKMADQQLEALEDNPYRISIDHFVWGSNSDILNQSMLFQIAHRESGELKYLNASLEMLDYIFGKNAVGYSFLSGFGDKQVMHFHHRPSGADDIDFPYPGFIAGGPNFRKEDLASFESAGIAYGSEFPAKAFKDHVASYASNEVCINWNAPAVFVLGYLEANGHVLK